MSCRKRFPYPAILRPFTKLPCRHASIDPAVRAARGLPEDLIRLCVGIEDPADLLDDLRHALIEAGAITYAANDFVRIPNPISRAVEKLALGQPRTEPRRDNREWFVSVPGKVILFGEHAVVHGVVSRVLLASLQANSDLRHRRPSLVLWICDAMV